MQKYYKIVKLMSKFEVEYAKAVKPKVVFPVHDGMLRQEHQLGPTRRIPAMLLEPLGIKYVDMVEGSVQDFNAII